ncbi:MAG: hypothetical protein K6L75_02710 [Cellvibrionaceae bacterium]
MFASTSSYSWEVSEGVTINELVQWEGSSFLVVRLSSDNTYHAPLVDKELYSLILSLYMSGRSFTIYGYDLAENINGYGDSHKIHRINAN